MTNGPDAEPAPAGHDISDEQAARLWETFLDAADPGSPAAFDRLYAGFLPAVIRYCRFRLRDAHLAEDVANTVFVRLLETRPAVKSSFIGLLLRTAHNMCASEAARPRPGQPLPLEPQTRPEADPGRESERQDTQAALTHCLDRLADPDRTLVVLHYGQGLTYRQIRDVLGLRAALSTFTRRLKRIKGELLRCLKEKGIF